MTRDKLPSLSALLVALCFTAAACCAEDADADRGGTVVKIPSEPSRQFDFWLGDWQVKNRQRLKSDGAWEEGEAVRRVNSMIDGYGLLQMTDFSWGEQSIAANAFDRQNGRWFEVGMSTNEPDCHWLSGVLHPAADFRLSEVSSSDNDVHHVWQSLGQDAYTWRQERHASGNAKGEVVLTVRFQRDGKKGRTKPTTNDKPTLAGKMAAVQSLLGQSQFAKAEQQLRQIAAEHKGDARPQYLLGYALHAQKKYDEALKSYRVAATLPPTKAMAEYNMACICSMQKKTDEAFAHLDTAIQAGFANFSHLATDAELVNLRADARFQKLIPKPLTDQELFSEPTRIIHKFVGEAAGDQFGWTARRAGDWDADGVEDFVSTAPTHAGSGKIYVYSSRSGKLLLEKQGQRGERFGNSAVGAGDVNNDGSPDLIVGGPNGAAAGNAYVYSGKDGKLIHHFKGQSKGDNFGYEVSEMGDIDGDKHADLLVGATVAKSAQGTAGKMFAYSGKTGKLIFQLEGERAGDSFGNAAACASHPRGGQLLAIGAQNAGPNKRGRVYVYRIQDSQPRRVFTLEGDSKSVNFGQMFIAFPGDVDGDGTPDIYASDFSDSTAVRGGGKVIVASGETGKPLVIIHGKRAGEGLGTSPSDAGDVNGDGVGDLVIGAWQNNSGAASGGKVYLHDGKTGRLLRAWTCRQAGDTFGFDACGIGDVDGDGATDFLLTSAWSNIGGQKTGRVFILAGDKSYTKTKPASK